MKAINLTQPWNIACVDLEKPVPGPGEALIKIKTAGICGSDIGAFRGTNGLVSYPRIIGHELAGIIESIPDDNPKGLKFEEIEAQTLPSSRPDLDLAVINSNYALGAGLNPTTDALAIESSDSPYVNVLVVKEGNENNEAIQALVEALHSDTIRDFINEEFDGAVVPAF